VIEMNIGTGELILVGVSFVAGLVLMHLFWVKEVLWWLEGRWLGFHHKHIIKCEGCEDCDEDFGLDDEGKSAWDKPRWHIGLSFKPKGDATAEDEVLFAKVGIDSDHSGFCFTHNIRDVGWTFYDDYARAHEAYHMLRGYMPTIANEWGIVTQYRHVDVGHDWDWSKKPEEL
jgi:hypothetical protein